MLTAEYEAAIREANERGYHTGIVRDDIKCLLAEIDRLRAIVAAGVDREAAYKLVCSELEAARVLSVSCVAACEWGLVVESDDAEFGTVDTDEDPTLIEAVDALKAQAGGG
jgi:hypothetical protein